MSSTCEQEWSVSHKELNKHTPEEKAKAILNRAAICEALYIPENDSVLVLTTTEYALLTKQVITYDTKMQAIINANQSQIDDDIRDAKEAFAEFIESEADTIKSTKAKHLRIDDKHLFIEVIELATRKTSYVSRVTIDSFITPKKIFKMEPIASGSSAQISATHDHPMKTQNRELNRVNFKKRFMKLEASISAKWNLKEPVNEQLRGEALARYIGVGSYCSKYETKFLKWLESFDLWIASINENLNFVYNDREERKQKLLILLDPDQTAKPAAAGKDSEQDEFDEQTLGHIQNEVIDIWGQSKDPAAIKLVREINAIDWESFSGEDEAQNNEPDDKSEIDKEINKTLIKNRKACLERISDVDLPEYIFNATAQAQFMRYACGSSLSVNFDPKKGHVGLKAETKGDVALAEGKVNAQFLLPNSNGLVISLPKLSKHEEWSWEVLNSEVTADSFVFNEKFLLPTIAENLSTITKGWDFYKGEEHNNKIRLVGHTDKPGSTKYNDGLSKDRAKIGYELLTYNYNSWNRRFEDGTWSNKEIDIMLCYLTLTKIDYRKVHSKDTSKTGLLTEKERRSHWERFFSMLSRGAIEFDQPHYINKKEGYDIKYPESQKGSANPGLTLLAKGMNIPTSISSVLIDEGAAMFNSPNYLEGAKKRFHKQALNLLIQSYMQKTTGNKFLLPDSFDKPAYVGKGELKPKKGYSDTDEHERVDQNRRVEIDLLVATKTVNGERVEHIPLGNIRLQINTYLEGYAGANFMLSAEAGFGGKDGDTEAKGLRAGKAKLVGKPSAKVYPLIENEKKKDMNVDAGVTGHVGAFAGAEVTAGIKAILEWKCPKPEPVFYQPNKLKDIPIQVKHEKEKSANNIILLAGFKNDFAELGSAGYAITGSVGIGLTGEIQIGFDADTGKFLFKCQAKLVVGKGGGGAFEFSINAKNVYWFIRFVHAQLNDHDFNYLKFMDEQAYDVFIAWTWALLKKGSIHTAGMVAFGMVAIKALSTWQELMTTWGNAQEKEAEITALAEQVNSENFLFSYMSPEIKARLLYILSDEKYAEEDHETAIIKLLNTVSSQNEYVEILEHMGPALSKIPEERAQQKLERLGSGSDDGTSEKRFFAVLDNGVIFRDGDTQLDEFYEWKRKLPAVAPKMKERK